MTSVIIVEDSTQLANLAAANLNARHGYSVTCVKDPHAMKRQLQQHQYDVAVIDLLFEPLNREFDRRRREGLVRLTASPILITGLSAITHLQQEAPQTRIVIWTSGEANRRLHLLYAYEELRQRVFCSKDSNNEQADELAHAIDASIKQVEYIDPGLISYLPAANAPTRANTILKDQFQRAVWRAVALGASSRTAISEKIGYTTHYIGNKTAPMYATLRQLDPGLPDSDQPFNELIRYASFNWHFFLDEAIREAFP